MKITSALIGLAALGGVALSSGAASAMPVAAPVQASSVVVPYGYGYGYYHPHYWGGWGWHRHYWHRWHRWHSWNTGD